MRQFKALSDNRYYLWRDEYHLYKEWDLFTRERPRYVCIMDGLITEDDEREMNNKENHVNNGVDKNRSQAFFLAYNQLMWLLFRPVDAALFWRFEVSYFVCLV